MALLIFSCANSYAFAAECIYSRLWTRQQSSDRPLSSSSILNSSRPSSHPPSPPPINTSLAVSSSRQPRLSAADDAKLIFGTIFSLRNMVRKLGGEDDSFISYRTSQYKLHYYETPTSIKFVMLTDTGSQNMRNVLHQIYVNLYVEFGTFLLLGRLRFFLGRVHKHAKGRFRWSRWKLTSCKS